MKKLSNYNNFDFNRFAQGKEFVIANSRFNENKGCVSLEVLIMKDASGENLYEKFKTHLVQETTEKAVEKYPIGSRIQFKQVGKCSVYGEYNANLSVEAIVEVK